MIAKAQSILINSEIIANGTPTIAEALKLCEKAVRIHNAGKRYQANAKAYQYKEIGGIK